MTEKITKGLKFFSDNGENLTSPAVSFSLFRGLWVVSWEFWVVGFIRERRRRRISVISPEGIKISCFQKM
jgi:hypothetical protein